MTAKKVSKQQVVAKANKQCQEFHNGLDKALKEADAMREALVEMFTTCGIDGSDAMSKYDTAVEATNAAKFLAREACRTVTKTLQCAGIPVPETKSGGGK